MRTDAETELQSLKGSEDHSSPPLTESSQEFEQIFKEDPA
jgi:hypothetical protein